MAKYADYAKKHADSLQAEIDQAGEGTQDRKDNPGDTAEGGFALPEKFKGKTPEEIAKSYSELEQAYSRQGQDLGTLRTTADELIRLQSTHKPAEEKEATASPLTYDDIYDDADAAVRRVVKEETGGKIEKLEQELSQARFNEKVSALDTKYSGWREEVKTPEFSNWVSERTYRARMAQQVQTAGDLDAAEELLAMYNDERGSKSTAQQASREALLRDASLETSGAEAADMTEKLSRSMVINKRVRAIGGDPEAQAWLAANGNAIALAYEEGRIID